MTIELKDISKSYGSLSVLNHISLSIPQDICCCLMAPSGAGKTTLMRILMGLEWADGGSIRVTGNAIRDNAAEDDAIGNKSGGPDRYRDFRNMRISAVFQEDRLCESFSPVENVLMTTGKSLKPSRVEWELSRLLPKECLTRPVSTLSGGMKRRTAILRALLTPSDILLMDEPFTGLDEDTRKKAIRCIKEKREGRFLLISTHQPEDVALLDGRLVRLDGGKA